MVLANMLTTWAVAVLSLLAFPHAVRAAPNSPSTAQSQQSASRSSCHWWQQSVRCEWGNLSKQQRKDYIRSVQCLMRRPSRIPPGQAPGAVSRYDDFLATHINETTRIHNDGIFLSWHRHFAWLFERALQQECAYRGTLPYWNWPLWAHDLLNSPYFDGSDTSLGGNGKYNATAVPIVFGGPLPNSPAQGGGPVTTGPFANRTAPFRNFVATEVLSMNGTVPFSALQPNPHPFRRDLNNDIASAWLTHDIVNYGIYESPNISDFQNWLTGDISANTPGPHSAGHLSIGLDMGDFFASPEDPMFFLHHGMVDLVWTMWQARDPKTRQFALSGGSTTVNVPPSANVTVNDYLNFGYLDKPQRIGDVMNVRRGQYCYRYNYKLLA